MSKKGHHALSPHYKSLDGVRGLAVLLVVAYHTMLIDSHPVSPATEAAAI